MPGYFDDWRQAELECPECRWRGPGAKLRIDEPSWDGFELCCPSCGQYIMYVSNPTMDEAEANKDRMSGADRDFYQAARRSLEEYEKRKLRETSQLPEINEPSFELAWDQEGEDTVIRHGEREIFRELVRYEGYRRFAEVALILRDKYGMALRDLAPTEASELYLYGDSLSAPGAVERARREILEGGDR